MRKGGLMKIEKEEYVMDIKGEKEDDLEEGKEVVKRKIEKKMGLNEEWR